MYSLTLGSRDYPHTGYGTTASTLLQTRYWKVYSMSKKETEALNAFLEEGLRTGKLEKSKSLYVSPFFFRLKHGMDELRGIQDY